jgi:chemotaxis signal transduction protein
VDNSEVLEKLSKGGEDSQAKETVERYHKFVVFRVDKRAFALPAEEVREISFDNQIYFVPFLPPYVRGYANRHGTPYTVMDIRMFFDKSLLESSTLLILDIPDDQPALLISDVEEIVKVPESEIHTLSSTDEVSIYFLESISLKGDETFVLNTRTLLERLENDVERI